jgi:hypothetical protein
MERGLLVTGNLAKPGNFSVTVNLLSYRIRKVGLARWTKGIGPQEEEEEDRSEDHADEREHFMALPAHFSPILRN